MFSSHSEQLSYIIVVLSLVTLITNVYKLVLSSLIHTHMHASHTYTCNYMIVI